jgi:hypothetical protein
MDLTGCTFTAKESWSAIPSRESSAGTSVAGVAERVSFNKGWLADTAPIRFSTRAANPGMIGTASKATDVDAGEEIALFIKAGVLGASA